MKFEFEIPDEKMRDIVTRHASTLNRSQSYSLEAAIQREVENALIRVAIQPRIQEIIAERSEKLINEAIDVKLGGWVKRKVKEFIKEKLS